MGGYELLRQKLSAGIDPLVIFEVGSPMQAYPALSARSEATVARPREIAVSPQERRPDIGLPRPTVALRALLPRAELSDLGSNVERLLRAAVDALTRSRRARERYRSVALAPIDRAPPRRLRHGTCRHFARPDVPLHGRDGSRNSTDFRRVKSR